ncbi:HmuY family protein [uncultured Porphyromonas sp.]|uniref:HmuY family protein n=1 Tax=uncultured Porphyromonas sp. TaxID=159274 RepID=UPI002803B213|nr:HmuY family protein [uncultured Porphyromonas sp.]
MKKLSLLTLLVLLLCTACNKPAPKPTPDTPDKPVVPPSNPEKEWMVKRMTIDATDYTKWVYLNFATGELVQVTDPANDLSWDLGLHRYDFKTNGGVSGKGKGAAVRIAKQKILTEEIPTPKDSQWELDREGLLLMQFEDDGLGSHRTKYEMQQANFLLSSECDGRGGFLNKGIITQEGMPPQVYIDNAIFLIRTASGEIVRLRVLDYQNNKKQRGYITIQYAMLVDKK